MRITTEIRTTHPTVQYGNVDLLTRYEYNSETDTLDKEQRIDIRNKTEKLIKLTLDGWSSLYGSVESDLKNNLGRIKPDDNKKQTKGFIKTNSQKQRRKRTGSTYSE